MITYPVATRHTFRSSFRSVSRLLTTGALSGALSACGGGGNPADEPNTGGSHSTGGSSGTGGSTGGSSGTGGSTGGNSGTGGSTGGSSGTGGSTGGSSGTGGSTGGSAGAGGTGGGEPVVQTSCDDYSNTQAPVVQSEPLHVLHHFSEEYAHPGGHTPEDALVEGPDGNLYGVTSEGGLGSNESSADGVAFRLSPDGTFTTLHTFVSTPRGGTLPNGALIVGPDCALYGVTRNGGGNTASGYANSGTVFRMTLAGEINYLARFPREAGWEPTGRLALASDGSFYGTTNTAGAFDKGTVFKLAADGTLSALASFDGATTGERPLDGLIEGSDGNFYGVTTYGGEHAGGTIFKVSPGGDFEVLWAFPSSSSAGGGNLVTGNVVEGPDGNFYGTTNQGGALGGGTIFRITPAGDYTTLLLLSYIDQDLDCNCGISYPLGRPIVGSDGALYALMSNGETTSPSDRRGAFVRVTLDGQMTPVALLPESVWPSLAGLTESTDGHLYGVAYTGGDDGGGAIMRAAMP
jgi:uncharacterized repeat protein (TIGR03803 family)